MMNNETINKIVREIENKYPEVNFIYLKESIEDNGIDIIIDNKKVFNSLSYSEFVYKNTIQDEISGKFINFLFADSSTEKEYIKTLECVFNRNEQYSINLLIEQLATNVSLYHKNKSNASFLSESLSKKDDEVKIYYNINNFKQEGAICQNRIIPTAA